MAATVVRHLLTGTPCPGLDCEECAVQSFLAGNLYLVAEKNDATPARQLN